MKWKLAISFLFAFIGFFLIEHVFTIQPDVISGNGNPGILMIMLFLPVFFLSYVLTFKQARDKTMNEPNKKKIMGFLLLSLVVFALLVIEIVNFRSELVIALGGNPTVPESKIYRFGWFNQYTNSMYFNLYTFLATHIVAVVIGVLSEWSKSRKISYPS